MISLWRRKASSFLWLITSPLYLVGVHGFNKPNTLGPTHNKEEAIRRKKLEELYGPARDKINNLETQINVRFEQIYAQTNAKLWPSIPMRFL